MALRYFNGYVSEFRFMRTDGGFASYLMIIEPWLSCHAVFPGP
jgi:type VI secretion system secreted protein VgrG